MLDEHLPMRLLQHLDLPLVHSAVIHVFFSESEQYSGGMHVVVNRLFSDIGSHDAVVNRRVSVSILKQMAFHSPQLRVSEQVSACQTGTVEHQWFFQFENVLLVKSALHELDTFLFKFTGECVQKRLHVYLE